MNIRIILMALLIIPAESSGIIDNIDDFICSFKAARFPEDILQTQSFTQKMIDFLITLPHAKGNPIFAAAKLGTSGAGIWLKKYLKDLSHMEIAENELLIACANNDLAVIDMLLQAGVSPNAGIGTPYKKTTALLKAIDHNNNEALEKLLKVGATNFDVKKSDNFDYDYSVLPCAAAHGNKKALHLLLQAGADQARNRSTCKAILCMTTRSMESFLHDHNYHGDDIYENCSYAIGYWPLGTSSSSDEIKKDLENKIVSYYNIEDFIPYTQSIFLFYPEEIPWLIEQLSECASAKNNPIFAAAKIGIYMGPAMSKYQLKTGIDTWLKEYLQDPEHMLQAEQELIIAAGNNDITVIDTLLAVGVCPNARAPRGLTPLANALSRRATKAIEKLLHAGAHY